MFQEVLSHIHPIVVHFPIVLIIVAACYDLFWLIKERRISPKKGILVWGLAFISAWIAVGTGPEHDARGNTNVFKYHEKLADIATFLAFIIFAVRGIFLFRKKEFVKLTLVVYCLFSMASAAAILSVGYFGGKMVYDQGVGVKMGGKYVNPPKPGKFAHND